MLSILELPYVVPTLPIEVGVRADIDEIGVLDERPERLAVGGVVQVAEDRDIVVLIHDCPVDPSDADGLAGPRHRAARVARC